MNAITWRFRVRPNTQDAQMVDQVFVRNEYGLPDDMEGWNVLDLGANIGAFAVACLLRGAAKVVCVEASHANFDLLVENTEGLHVRCLYAAVAAKIGMAPFHSSPVWTACGHLVAVPNGTRPPDGNPFVREVRTLDLDFFLDRYGPFRLIKMDVEGAELAVLQASQKLATRVYEVVGEAHPTGPQDDALAQAQKCAEVLQKAGLPAVWGRHPWNESRVALFHGIAAGTDQSCSLDLWGKMSDGRRMEGRP